MVIASWIFDYVAGFRNAPCYLPLGLIIPSFVATCTLMLLFFDIHRYQGKALGIGTWPQVLRSSKCRARKSEPRVHGEDPTPFSCRVDGTVIEMAMKLLDLISPSSPSES